MNKERLSYLLKQYMTDQAGQEELDELTGLLQDDSNRELFMELLAGMLEQEPHTSSFDKDSWQKMLQQIMRVEAKTVPVPKTRGVIRRLKWAAAAVIVMLLAFGAFYTLVDDKENPVDNKLTGKDAAIARDSTRAFLVLANGSEVYLDDMANNTTIREDGIEITKRQRQLIYTANKDSTAAEHTVFVPRGSIYQVVWSDGSQAWLNAASSIRFPASFGSKERVVELTGEAFFDVKHSKEIPFTVHNGNITTRVLGTAFIVRSWPGESPARVAVRRGKVSVHKSNAFSAVLEKGQAAKISADGSVVTEAIDTLSIGSWTEGRLIYRNERLEDIVADLQRTFDQNIIIERTELRDLRITVAFGSNSGASQALDVLCRLTDASFLERGGKFFIK